jgi:excisionase family DNA binding protein
MLVTSIMSHSTQDINTKVNQIDRTESAMLTADQAHELTGGDSVISRASFYAGIGRREIPSVRVGRRILIPRHAFLRWLEGKSGGGAAA